MTVTAVPDPVTETASTITTAIVRHRQQREAALAAAAAHRQAIADLTISRNQHIREEADNGRPLAYLARLYYLSRERARQIVTTATTTTTGRTEATTCPTRSSTASTSTTSRSRSGGS